MNYLNSKRIVYVIISAFCMVLVFGCAPVKEPVISEPEVIKPKIEEKPKPPPRPPAKKKKPKPDVEILLSGKASSYSDIAHELNALLEKPAKIHMLTGSQSVDQQIIDELQDSSHKQLVAVGLKAANAVRNIENKQIIFSQVFNYRDHGLITANMKGVGVLPAAQKLFQDWKELSPQLQRVLVITGNDLDDYIEEAHQAARKHGIDLIHKVVRNDKEFIYLVKHNDNVIQGHWLLADNRVLSVRALKEIMAFNSKEGIQTIVFQPKLLSFGGLFYVKPSEKEISKKIFSRLKASISKEKVVGKDIVFLDRHDMGINAKVAKQLGIDIPEEFKALIHE